MEVFIEDVIFDNFVIDLIILFITAKILKIRFKIIRLCFAAAVGVGFNILSLLTVLPGGLEFVFKIVLSLLMVTVAFKFVSAKQFFVRYFTFIFVTFLCGGGCLAVAFTFGGFQVVGGQILYNLDVAMWVIALVLFGVGYLLVQIVDWVKNNSVRNGFMYFVELEHNNKIFKLKGFLDTGNTLTDNGQPVILITYNVFERVYKIPFQNAILGKFEGLENAHYVEAGGIGKKNKIMVFDVKNIKIIQKNYKKIIKNAKFGLIFANLEKKLDCELLLNSKILGDFNV